MLSGGREAALGNTRQALSLPASRVPSAALDPGISSTQEKRVGSRVVWRDRGAAPAPPPAAQVTSCSPAEELRAAGQGGHESPGTHFSARPASGWG